MHKHIYVHSQLRCWNGLVDGECMWEGMRMRVRLYEKSAQLLLFAFFHLHIVLSFRPVVLDARSIAHAEWVYWESINFEVLLYSLTLRTYGMRWYTDTLMVSNGYDDLWCSFSLRWLSTICDWRGWETFIHSFILSRSMLIPDLDWGYML